MGPVSPALPAARWILNLWTTREVPAFSRKGKFGWRDRHAHRDHAIKRWRQISGWCQQTTRNQERNMEPVLPQGLQKEPIVLASWPQTSSLWDERYISVVKAPPPTTHFVVLCDGNHRKLIPSLSSKSRVKKVTLVVQGLRLQAPNAGGPGFSPWSGN